MRSIMVRLIVMVIVFSSSLSCVFGSEYEYRPGELAKIVNSVESIRVKHGPNDSIEKLGFNSLIGTCILKLLENEQSQIDLLFKKSMDAAQTTYPNLTSDVFENSFVWGLYQLVMFTSGLYVKQFPGDEMSQILTKIDAYDRSFLDHEPEHASFTKGELEKAATFLSNAVTLVLKRNIVVENDKQKKDGFIALFVSFFDGYLRRAQVASQQK